MTFDPPIRQLLVLRISDRYAGKGAFLRSLNMKLGAWRAGSAEIENLLGFTLWR